MWDKSRGSNGSQVASRAAAGPAEAGGGRCGGQGHWRRRRHRRTGRDLGSRRREPTARPPRSRSGDGPDRCAAAGRSHRVLLARIDLDQLIARVDLNQALGHVDLNELLDRVDPNLVFDRVDVGRLLDQVDLNRLIDRVDPDRLLDRVDLDRLLAQVDLDRALSTVDVKALTARSGIPEVVAESTSRMAGSALDVARRQVAGLDLLIDRGLRRRPATIKPGPQRLLGATSEEGRYSVTGYYAGPLSRAVGAVLDAIIVFATFTLGFAAVNLLSSYSASPSIRTALASWRPSPSPWWFSYSFVCLAVSGRTVGKGLIGIRVVAADGQSVTVRGAFVRTLPSR